MPLAYNNAKVKLQTACKNIQLNHINDLQVIKKPSQATFKIVQIFSWLIYSFKKDFEIHSRYFQNWADLVSLLCSSTKLIHDVKGIQVKIDNQEYKTKTINLIKNEFTKSEKLFLSNKVQPNSTSHLFLTFLMAVFEYIAQIEDLKKSTQWTCYSEVLKMRVEHQANTSYQSTSSLTRKGRSKSPYLRKLHNFVHCSIKEEKPPTNVPIKNAKS